MLRSLGFPPLFPETLDRFRSDLLWFSLIELFVTGLALLLTSVPLSVPRMRTQVGAALVTLSIWSVLVGGAFAVLANVPWGWATVPGFDLSGELDTLGSLLLCLASLPALASVVALTGADWAWRWLLGLQIVLGVVGVGVACTQAHVPVGYLSAAYPQSVWSALYTGPVPLLAFWASALSGGLGPLIGSLAIGAMLYSLASTRALRPPLLRTGLLGSSGAGLVVALLLVRGANDWNDVSAGLDVLLASLVMGTVLAVVAAVGARHRPPADARPEAPSRSRSTPTRGRLSGGRPPAAPRRRAGSRYPPDHSAPASSC